MISLSSIIEHREEKIKAVVERVCELHGLLPTTIFTTKRHRHLVEARQECWYFVRKHVRSATGNKISYTELGTIAKYWNIDIVWNHASILHACRSIAGRRDVDKLFDRQMEANDDIFKTMMEHYQFMSNESNIMKPSLHYFEMLGYLTHNLSMRYDTEEVDFLIETLTDRRSNEADQDSSEDIEMEVVQGATN